MPSSSGSIVSVSDLKNLPRPYNPEIAFAGRSNVGKSSLINTVLGRRIAPISGTPGKTRSIRFYPWTFKRFAMILVDLPGYGWAKLPESIRMKWRYLVEGYFSDRPSLCGIVLVVDIRRGENDLDIQMADWLNTKGMEYIVVANKVDKISRSKRRDLLGQIARGTATPLEDIIPFSSITKEGKQEVMKRFFALCAKKDRHIPPL